MEEQGEARTVPWWGLGGTRCAVCREPLEGTYDVLAHQVRHNQAREEQD